MTSVNILLVDDHPIVREDYHRLLERQPGFHVCAEADNAEDAYRAYKDHCPDIVVMDLTLPGVSGLEQTAERDPCRRLNCYCPTRTAWPSQCSYRPLRGRGRDLRQRKSTECLRAR